MKNLINLFTLVLIALLFACEPGNPEPEIVSNIKNGVFITNEGHYNGSNASVSFFSKDSAKMTNNLVKNLTGDDLGDVLQSMSVFDGKAYFVLNNSQKVVVMNLETYEVENITNLSYPRYVAKVADNKAYISNGNGYGQNNVYVLNIETNTIQDSISVGIGPETFFKDGDNVYVTCKGGWSVDSMVYVIDAVSDVVTDTILVGDVPLEIEKDAWGKLWVLCAGRSIFDDKWNVIGSVPGSLMQIDPITKTVTKNIQFTAPLAGGISTNNLAIDPNGETLYINNADVWAYDISTNKFTTLISSSNWYGIDVDPSIGNIWGCNSTTGKVEIYNNAGNKLSEYAVGIFPNGAYFIE